MSKLVTQDDLFTVLRGIDQRIKKLEESRQGLEHFEQRVTGGDISLGTVDPITNLSYTTLGDSNGHAGDWLVWCSIDFTVSVPANDKLVVGFKVGGSSKEAYRATAIRGQLVGLWLETAVAPATVLSLNATRESAGATVTILQTSSSFCGLKIR
jgi:hypothetical protein